MLWVGQHEVGVTVDIDEAGGDHKVSGVDHSLGVIALDHAHPCYSAVVHADVGDEPRAPRSVHYAAVPDHQVVQTAVPPRLVGPKVTCHALSTLTAPLVSVYL